MLLFHWYGLEVKYHQKSPINIKPISPYNTKPSIKKGIDLICFENNKITKAKTITNWPSLLKKGVKETIIANQFHLLVMINQTEIVINKLKRGSVNPANKELV